MVFGLANLSAADSQANFVVVLADDIGWDAFGCTDSTHARTPNIDKLAKQSIFMARLYCSVSKCAPLRAEFYTGLLPNRNGVRANAKKEKRKQLYLKSSNIYIFFDDFFYGCGWIFLGMPEARNNGFEECVLCNFLRGRILVLRHYLSPLFSAIP